MIPVITTSRISNKLRARLQSGELCSRPNISEDQDYIIKLVENILTCVRLLSKANDREDCALAIAVFAQCRANRSLVSVLTEKWDSLMSLSLQSGQIHNTFQSLKNILSKYDMVKKLPIFTKIYKFLLYCVGTSLFEKMGIKFDAKKFLRVEKAVIKKEYYMGPDFIHCVLDTILFVSETGYQCMVTGSIDPILHHETSYEKWIQEGETLRIQSKYISNPEPHGFTVFDFLSRLDDNIEKGKAIVRFLAKNEPCAMVVRRLLSDLVSIRADCKTKRLAQQERKAPFAVLVHGGSSVAKSQFTKLLYYHYGKMFNLPIADEFKYTRNAFDQYWTNFNSSQWCLQLDDIAYLHPNKATECDPSLVEMLQVVNNVPYVPTQADLADKGKTPVRSRFVIATTNTENLNAETYFACPLAVQRRLPYVLSIEPKDIYRKENGPMIDPLKIPESKDGEYPDLWRITVKRVAPAPQTARKSLHMGQTAVLITESIFEDIYSFLQWFSAIARSAEGTQEKALKCDHDMRSVSLCTHDVPVNSCPTCSSELSLQAGELIEYVDTPWVREVHRRLTEDTEGFLGYQYTIRHIMRCISVMSIFHRIVAAWYFSLLWIMQRYPTWGTFFISLLYGNWCFFLIACRLLHIPEMRHICMYLIGHKAYRAIRSPKAVVFCASLVAAVTLLKAGQMILDFSGYFPKEEELTPEHCYQCNGCKTCKHISHEKRSEIAYKHVCDSNLCSRCTHKREMRDREIVLALSDDDCLKCSRLQSEVRDKGVAPTPKNDKKENVWYKDQFECTPFDVSLSSLSKSRWTMDDFVKHISANCASYTVRARTDDTVKEKYGKTICIGGHSYLFNNHCVPFDSFELSIIFQSSKDGLTTNFTMLVTPGQMHRIPERDLLFIQLPSIPPKKDIRDLFAKPSFEGRFDGEYVCRSGDGSIKRVAVLAPKFEKKFFFSDSTANVHLSTPIWKGKVYTNTVDGDCGSVLITTTSMGPLILGIHVLGGRDCECVALAVDHDLLSSLQTDIFSDNSPTLQVGDYAQELVNLSKKATVRYIEEGTMVVYGSLAGFRGKLKSRVVPTLMNELAVRDGYECNTGPPLMNSWIPWRRALLDMARPVSHIDLTLLEHCVDSFSKDILDSLTQSDLSELHVYPLNVAVNGCPGLAYVDKMPRNTSAGFPFRKSKKYFLEAIAAFGDYQHPVKVTPEIEQEMDRIVECYESGRVYCPVFTASLKDEPTALHKIQDGKTRVFCGAPLPWSLVVRMYLLPVIRLIQKNRFLFEAGPGTIAQSTEWDDIYKYITQYGEHRIVAGDYGKFDKRMPASVILAAFQIIKNILASAGWSAEDLRVVGGIAEDTAFPTIDFHGELIRCYGTNPSGHPLTVIINGVANSLYVRYCYTLNHPDKTCSDFKKHVALFTYGDDMIMGVKESCYWLNHTIMQETLAAIDIEFTMAEKAARSVPFIHVKQASFLKRSWRFESQLGCMVCPIDHSSISKMLTMCVESKTVSRQLQAVAVLNTACREYFWYGENIFHQRRALFYKWIDELDLYPYLEEPLPTWGQLKREFEENSHLREYSNGFGSTKLKLSKSCVVPSNPHIVGCTVPDPKLCDGVCRVPQSNSTNGPVDHPGVGLASLPLVLNAFEDTNNAHRGMCQSCAAKLDMQQCVVNSEPHVRNTFYFTTPEASPALSSDSREAVKTSSAYSTENPPDLHLQSEEAEFVMDATENNETTQTTVAEFLDETPGITWGLEHPVLTNLSDRQPEIELAKFLNRPVLIKTHTWAQTDTANLYPTWDPWYLFFNSAPIKSKLNNYGFINCTLKLKFVINASPFYYGAMAFTYCPLQNLVGENIIADPIGGELLLYSQRPKVWIFPQTCQGGELHLPFFYHKNWLDVTSAQATKDMGTITPALYSELTSATGITGTSVIVNIYAWAEDVKLHAPTTKLALQADEFDYKPSQIASSVAKATGSLTRIPLIGPYMKATSVVSSGFARIASALGFTNVPNMDTVCAYKPTPFPHNSTCEVSVPTDRSCVDPKNEVCIDPRTVGLDGQDELSISYICGRETWIGNAILSSTDAVDALTLVSRVSPGLAVQHTVVNPLQCTPMAYLATQFAYWRGDIIFRFKFLCTRFHKGRVRITFDPINDISTSVPDYTTVFNEVVDIGAEQDIEIRVPYSQALTFLRCNTVPGNYNLQGTALSPDTFSNGLITMRVVNPLSGPIALAAIPVMVFVRAAENFEFAHPNAKYSGGVTASPYILQSKEVEYAIKPVQVIAGNSPSVPDPNRYHVHFGEAITSLRPLVHRLAHQYTAKSNDFAVASTMTTMTFYQSRRLKYPGFDTSGIFTANKTLSAGTAPYNFFRMNIHQMVSLMYIGERGSITHSVNIETNNAGLPSNVQFKRYVGTIGVSSYSLSNSVTAVTGSTIARNYMNVNVEPGSGVALTDFHNQPGLVMNFPYYSNYNFQIVNPANTTLGSSVDGSNFDQIVLQVTYEQVPAITSNRVNFWASYGPDYNFFFFRNVPSLYVYTIPTGV